MKWWLDNVGSIHDLVADQRLSGSELGAAAARRAAVLGEFCTSRSDHFVIAHGDSPDFFADLFAVWQVGGCAVCVTPSITQSELDKTVAFADARAVLVGAEFGMTADVPILSLVQSTQRSQWPSSAPPQGVGALDDPALMLFTSGTTGDPKGVVHTHRSLLARLALNHAHIGTAALARSLCVLPTHFGHGLIGNCLTPLMTGGDVFLMHGQGLAGAARLGATVDDHQITFMSSVPAFWKLALRASKPPARQPLQRVHIGSAPLAASLWRDVIAWSGTDRVANMYGITETANWIGGALASELTPADGLLGRGWGTHFAVLGDDGRATATGHGEILIQTPSLMTGYHQRPDLTDAVMADGWYRTGDTGEIDASGLLRMTGRNRYVINRAGIKIYPEELDLLLERHPDVVEACAFGIPDRISGEVAAVAVTLTDGAQTDAPALIAWARQFIRTEAVPARIFIIADIPKTDRGKLNRDNVAAHCVTQETSQ